MGCNLIVKYITTTYLLSMLKKWEQIDFHSQCQYINSSAVHNFTTLAVKKKKITFPVHCIGWKNWGRQINLLAGLQFGRALKPSGSQFPYLSWRPYQTPLCHKWSLNLYPNLQEISGPGAIVEE